jgi:hypothetical protein
VYISPHEVSHYWETVWGTDKMGSAYNSDQSWLSCTLRDRYQFQGLQMVSDRMCMNSCDGRSWSLWLSRDGWRGLFNIWWCRLSP